MRAAFIVDSHDWSGQYVNQPPARRPTTQAYLAFGTGYAATMQGDAQQAAASREALERAVREMSEDSRAYAAILSLELRGLLVRAAMGDSSGALPFLREAARAPGRSRAGLVDVGRDLEGRG